MLLRRAALAACLAALGLAGRATADDGSQRLPPTRPAGDPAAAYGPAAERSGGRDPWLVGGTGALAMTSIPGVRIGGIDYVGLASVAEQLGLGLVPSLQGKERVTILKLGSRPVAEFDEHNRSADVFGVTVSLGDPVAARGERLYISRIDYERCIVPILRPAFCGRPPAHPRVIALDPGHGGVDHGTSNARLGLFEKTFTLDTAERVRRILQARGYRVLMTRTTDVKIELQERPQMAAREGADLFVSIHFNASPAAPQLVRGLEVYRFTPQFQVPVTRQLRKPDDSLPGPGNANDVWNTILAFNMQRTLLARLHMNDRGLRHDRYAVLHWAECPAILIEGGFLSNDAEARLIATPAYRDQLAGAIADGIDAYGRELDNLRPGAR